ncbi:MAG: hypothetical protein M3Y34_01730 [Actinomycetota bacterium]|nr:hypothetical protein [Actinomycetota bacterium]
MRRIISFIAATALVLALSAPSALGANKVVDVADDFFAPAEETIKEDKTVDFNWVGVNEHNVFRQAGPGRYFESEPMTGEGVLYSKKFKRPGNYVLGCILHPDMDLDLKVKKRRR